MRDLDGSYLAVFKPKDEEPFAALNPKWPKFFQRVLCFCCFGRACLIPNSGYLSETGASIVDAWMQLGVVPKTRVVKLASPSFFYTRCCGRVEVKPKEGSFQLFVHGFESAHSVFARWEYDKNLLSEEEDKKFTTAFQKMCVLDYVIRNTDRHLDNLLIRLELYTGRSTVFQTCPRQGTRAGGHRQRPGLSREAPRMCQPPPDVSLQMGRTEMGQEGLYLFISSQGQI